MGEILLHNCASGAIWKRLLEILQQHGKDTRLVVSHAGEITLKHECGISKEELAQATGAKLEDGRISVANPPQVQQKSMRL